MADRSHARALLDTSVVIDLEQIGPERLPGESAISIVTVAELAAGPHATADPLERARRQERLQRVEAAFDPLPLDASAARAYGLVFATVARTGAQPRRRAFDLLIAATALAAGLPLYTRNVADFGDLDELLEVVPVEL